VDKGRRQVVRPTPVLMEPLAALAFGLLMLVWLLT
jgi:hypothetical protein